MMGYKRISVHYLFSLFDQRTTLLSADPIYCVVGFTIKPGSQLHRISYSVAFYRILIGDRDHGIIHKP